MSDIAPPTYAEVLAQALIAKKDSLETSAIPRLKDELRLFQVSFAVLYGLYIKKKLINEDPYKHENKITELEIPESGPLNEARRREQISLRLASFDSQLDFLVNFYQFGVDYLGLGRIRKIAGLVRYIDWMNLTPDSKSPNTKIVAEISLNSKTGDAMTLNIIGEALTKLSKCTASVMGILRDLTIYHRENYKLAVRGAIKGIPAHEAGVAGIRRRISAVSPKAPFFQEFVEEVIAEDFAEGGMALKEAVLASLAVKEAAAKAVKPTVDYKEILLHGIRSIGMSASVLTEIAEKVDENERTLAQEKRGFWIKLKKWLMSLFNIGSESVIYDLVYVDPAKGTKTREELNLHQFRADLDRRIKILSGMSKQGTVLAKLAAMPEEQVQGYLERTIADVQVHFRTLIALDDYFKTTAKDSRDNIKGIKPELSTVKNCIIKANQVMHDYSAAKEEAEQLKRLGVTPAK